jgi:hypothetical protein
MGISAAQDKTASNPPIDAKCNMALKYHHLITCLEYNYSKTCPPADHPLDLPASISVSLSSFKGSRNVNNLWINWR